MSEAYSLCPIAELSENFDAQRRPVRASDRRSGRYPYYGAQGVVDYVENYLFDGEFVLVAEDGENLRSRKEAVALLASGRFWVNNHAHILRGKIRTDTRFLFYAINAADISGYVTGSTIPKLSQGNLNRILVPCPPSSERESIAAILGALDDKIELNRRMNETLEAMARAIFKDWFVDFGPTRAKMAGQTPYLAPEIWSLFPDQLDNEGKPEGWRNSSLESFTQIQNGYAFKSSDWQDAGIPVVKIGSVKPAVVDMNEISYISQSSAAERMAYRLEVGDVLVGLTGYVGETGRVPPTDKLPLLNQRVGKFSTSDKFYSFVYLCVRDPAFKQFAESKSHGSAQSNVSTKDLLKYCVIEANTEIFLAYEKFVRILLDKNLLNLGEINKLAATRDFLLPKLMSGEIRVKDAERAVEDAA